MLATAAIHEMLSIPRTFAWQLCLQDWFLPNSSTQPNPNQQPELFPLWVLHFAYCAMAVAVASCSLAERGTLAAHVLLAIVMSSWIYPVVVHWVWSTEGAQCSTRRSATAHAQVLNLPFCAACACKQQQDKHNSTKSNRAAAGALARQLYAVQCLLQGQLQITVCECAAA
jgi:hypothetical protein